MGFAANKALLRGQKQEFRWPQFRDEATFLRRPHRTTLPANQVSIVGETNSIGTSFPDKLINKIGTTWVVTRSTDNVDITAKLALKMKFMDNQYARNNNGNWSLGILIPNDVYRSTAAPEFGWEFFLTYYPGFPIWISL